MKHNKPRKALKRGPKKPIEIRRLIRAVLFVGMCVVCSAFGEEPANEPESVSLWERETLTNNWFGLGNGLAKSGISVNLGVTQVFQANLHGGMSTHRRSGRYAGSYDLELEFDTEKLLGLSGGTVFLLAEGSWSDGIDASSVGSLFGVNDDAGGYRSIDVTELWYEQSLLDGGLRVRLGKVDLTGGFSCRGCPVAFDGNSYANDETAQFLNGTLVNNPSIPFPDNGLGMMVYLELLDWCYVSAGVDDAQADARETGFNTAFNGENHFFSVFEAGVTPQIPSANGPLQGAYRVGFWYDPQSKERFDSMGSETDDIGLYLSFDQVVFKENGDEEDNQGLGVFACYGAADGDVNEIWCFWSVGAQYQGLLVGRDDDVLAFGAAQGRLSRSAGFTASHETALELYYSIQLAPWLSVTPSVQYIFNPGGLREASDAVVAGLRLQIAG